MGGLRGIEHVTTDFYQIVELPDELSIEAVEEAIVIDDKIASVGRGDPRGDDYNYHYFGSEWDPVYTSASEVYGTRWNDYIQGDWTDQTFYPIAGSDEIDGGDGYDTVVINESFDDVIVLNDYSVNGYGSFPVNSSDEEPWTDDYKVLKFATAEDKESYFTPKILGNMAVLSKDGAFSATVNGNHLVIENLSDNSIEDFLLPDMLSYSDIFGGTKMRPFSHLVISR